MSESLPEGWCETVLGEISSKPQYGWTCSATNYGKLKLLRTTDISNGTIDWDKVPFCSKKPYDENKFLLKKNDILVSRAGSVGISYKVREEDLSFKTVFASYLIRFCPIISPSFVAHFLKSQLYWHFISDSQLGIAVPNVNATKLSELPIPLPPLTEQKRITAKLDKIIPGIEATKERLERIPAIIKRFRQSVLIAAVMGKLTERWRKEQLVCETSAQLVESIKKKRLKKVSTKPQQIKIEQIYAKKEQNDFNELPENWLYVFLNKLCESFQYGTSSKSHKKGKIPVLRMGNLQNGKIDWSNLVYSSDDEEIKKYMLKSGDVLFNRTNSADLVGKTSIYLGEEPAIFAGYLIKINNFKSLDSNYLNYALNSQYAKDYYNQVKSDAVNQSNINAQKLGKFEIPLPPYEEQKEIVRQVNKHFSFADKLESHYKKAKEKIDKLPQSVLVKAFRGELVPQDPDDEPAEKLLERIKEEKTNMETELKKAKKNVGRRSKR